MQAVQLTTLFCLLIALASAQMSRRCLDCVCQVESNCNPNVGCVMDEGSLSCGPYQIKEVYWIDCGRPGASWMSCADSMSCSEQCIQAYMVRYGTYCTGGRQPTCQDYARIHNRGPQGCQSNLSLEYWQRVQACCGCSTCCD